MPWGIDERLIHDPMARRGFAMIGGAMRRRRHKLGLTQRDLERITGVSQSAISRLENGHRFGLRWPRFMRLVAALDGLDFGTVDIPRVITPAGLSPRADIARAQLEDAAYWLGVQRGRLDRAEAELVAMRRRLDDADRAA
jgi:transcriptional regulator with XRE-family HTH domain